MAGTKTTKTAGEKYAALISKTDAEKSKEMLSLEVEQAENVLQQGTLSVKGQLIAQEGKVKQAQINVKKAEGALKATHGAAPFNVNNIISARVRVLESEQELAAQQEAYEELKGHFDYLVALKSELF
jgi:hypothetical protein